MPPQLDIEGVLRPPPVFSSRARAARVAGTSRTCSPAAASCWPVASITTWVTPSACSQSARVSRLEVKVG